MSENLISIKDAAKKLGVTKLTLRNWDKQGKLVALRHPMNNYRVYEIKDVSPSPHWRPADEAGK